MPESLVFYLAGGAWLLLVGPGSCPLATGLLHVYVRVTRSTCIYVQLDLHVHEYKYNVSLDPHIYVSSRPTLDLHVHGSLDLHVYIHLDLHAYVSLDLHAYVSLDLHVYGSPVYYSHTYQLTNMHMYR